MRVTTRSKTLVIQLEGMECVYALRRKLVVPKSSIVSVTWQPEFTDWRRPEFRLPGSFLPGAIIAGSFYTKQGWDFIYSTKPRGWTHPTLSGVMVVETNKKRYARVIVGVPESMAKEVATWHKS